MIGNKGTFPALFKLLPEGVSLSEIQYSAQNFKIRGWTTNSNKVRHISSWLSKAGIIKSELKFARRMKSGEVEFEVMGKIPFQIESENEDAENRQING